ncbi:hypothetical protein KJ590_04665 [Patescibacteria group bacterium]|nr:hypothetical protein [Candidatus Omnitrophota bacterium]MBU4143255.1 hypothetical protein [Patescibacteria group bacterium]
MEKIKKVFNLKFISIIACALFFTSVNYSYPAEGNCLRVSVGKDVYPRISEIQNSIYGNELFLGTSNGHKLGDRNRVIIPAHWYGTLGNIKKVILALLEDGTIRVYTKKTWKVTKRTEIAAKPKRIQSVSLEKKVRSEIRFVIPQELRKNTKWAYTSVTFAFIGRGKYFELCPGRIPQETVSLNLSGKNTDFLETFVNYTINDKNQIYIPVNWRGALKGETGVMLMPQSRGNAVTLIALPIKTWSEALRQNAPEDPTEREEYYRKAYSNTYPSHLDPQGRIVLKENLMKNMGWLKHDNYTFIGAGSYFELCRSEDYQIIRPKIPYENIDREIIAPVRPDLNSATRTGI